MTDATATSAPEVGFSTDEILSLGIDTDAFGLLASHPEYFMPSGVTKRVVLGRETNFQTKIGNQTFEGYAIFKSGRLRRMSLIEQQRRSDGANYNLLTFVLTDVRADIGIYQPNGGKTPVSRICWDFANAASTQKGGQPIDRERFMRHAANLGFHFDGTMAMMCQHFGADPSKTDAAIEQFKEWGAQEDMARVRDPKRIRQAYVLDNGPTVVEFEMGQQDRARTQFGTGFLDPVDAIVSNFSRVLVQRAEFKKRDDALLQVEQGIESGNKPPKGWDEAKIKDERLEVDALGRMARDWVQVWTGAQQRSVDIEGKGVTKVLQMDATNMPCGRLTILPPGLTIPSDLSAEARDDFLAQNALRWDFWQDNRVPAEGGEAVPIPVQGGVSTASVTGTKAGDEEPF